MTAKITTGLNDRARDESISSTAPGLPDDSSQQVEIDEAEAERMAANLKGKSPKDQLKDDIDLPLKGSA